MVPVVVVDFDSNASLSQQQTVLEACNRVIAESECVTRADADSRPTRAIAVVSWASPQKAHLELGLPTADRWVTHEMEFRREEPETERWRAVGFTIATLLGEEAALRHTDDSPLDARPTHETVDPTLPSAGVGVAPRLSIGLDRATSLAGAELRLWASPFTTWTPVLGAAYVGPARPALDVHWRETELVLGAALRQPWPAVELRWALLLAAKRIAVSDDADSLAVWVPGVQAEGELRWPARGFWTLSSRLRVQWNDGATGIQQGGERLASSPAWLAGASLGLEAQF